MLRLVCIAVLTATLAVINSAQVVPIFDAKSGGFLGGVRDGKFLDAATAFKEIKGTQEYSVIGPFGEKRDLSAAISGPTELCEDYYFIDRQDDGFLGVAIGKGLTWNPVPRPLKPIATTNKTYLAAVSALLRSKGMMRSKAVIEQAVSGDFDGDGVDEVLITASSYRGNIMAGAKRGDYSVVFMRKVVAGKVRNIVLGSEFIKKDIQFGAPTRFEISGIADLDGDGRMEIVMYDEYYEGAGAGVYEVTKTGVENLKLLNAGCGV